MHTKEIIILTFLASPGLLLHSNLYQLHWTPSVFIYKHLLANVCESADYQHTAKVEMHICIVLT